MLKDHDILYLAGHDYNLPDTRISTDHLARQLARSNRLLYVESVGLRVPRLDANDLSRIGRKCLQAFKAPRRVGDGFWVLTPLAIPLHHNSLVRRANKYLLLAQIRWAAARLRFRKPLLFVFLPSMAGVVGCLGETLSVYYCTDEHAAFPGVDARSVRVAEEDLLGKVTIGFATSEEILVEKTRLNSSFHSSPHGVDFDHFARARDASMERPVELVHVQSPIIGYFGAIDRWLDLELIWIWRGLGRRGHSCSSASRS